MRKADIYAKYGIEYKGGKIQTPIGPMNELLKKGNSKVGKAVLTWSMNTTTCAVQCAKCYGRRGFYNMSNVKKSLAMNTELATKHLDFFKRALFAQLETLPAGTEIRIHAVGDFFSGEYADVWHDAAERFPELIFWTYTKRVEMEDKFDDLDNANIVKSIVNGKFNFGHCDHVMNMYAELKEAGEKVHICRCGVDDEQHCAGCHECSVSKYVLFLEHSTEYDAKKDPLFNELAELINRQ